MKLRFRRNVGNLDRTIRVMIGTVLTLIVIFQPFNISTTWQWLIGLTGIASVAEGVLGY